MIDISLTGLSTFLSGLVTNVGSLLGSVDYTLGVVGAIALALLSHLPT